jgi:hypothetical protein
LKALNGTASKWIKGPIWAWVSGIVSPRLPFDQGWAFGSAGYSETVEQGDHLVRDKAPLG